FFYVWYAPQSRRRHRLAFTDCRAACRASDWLHRRPAWLVGFFRAFYLLIHARAAQSVPFLPVSLQPSSPIPTV
ncbi:hypothetical protein EXIGLDRAFT_730909, partial [Exidia glandulosa HHB12029]